ncbi:purine-nucleoside phosphorylase [Ornithobacterium rhinotracheale]|uniref:purine-nucleoside phosphorylase n=1 Tax=Ornithobacterium rhinotracheale TaxID=28251 RepID=UPI00129CC92C|nr:purine-nucleoside phosphorylase [Ornithobacterium rhinotracheale]MRJ08690.1 purine-nucleoside phosphorylase [Ornithobacterium rhinotracheale]UOH76864.1 purine-nucleoside phosphorylase [Ornithobacterium rhinotracheale]
MYKKIQEATNYIKDKIGGEIPEFAIVLGSGLGALKDEVKPIVKIPYTEIPDFPQTTVKGHNGELIFGTLEGKKVLLMAGRFHYYEGYSMKEVTFPFRVFHLLGIKNLIVSNASGGVNPDFKVGDVMVIRDHINMFPEHPLRGQNMEEFGPRFPEMSKAYDYDFIAKFDEIAKRENIDIKKGVYVGLQGPTFETPAEYGMVRILGGDAVGMSTVPEVIVARHQGMRVAALSVITDLGGPEISIPVSHEEVLNAANVAMPNVIKLVKSLVAEN